jgi:hypothetical protein
MMRYQLFNLEKKIDLTDIIGKKAFLQPKLRFSPGAEYLTEHLHHEDCEDENSDAFEILIPQSDPIKILISPVTADVGTPALESFEKVEIAPDQGIILFSKTCHVVVSSGPFLVLKSLKGFKHTNYRDPSDAGHCKYTEKCKAIDQCPTAKKR